MSLIRQNRKKKERQRQRIAERRKSGSSKERAMPLPRWKKKESQGEGDKDRQNFPLVLYDVLDFISHLRKERKLFQVKDRPRRSHRSGLRSIPSIGFLSWIENLWLSLTLCGRKKNFLYGQSSPWVRGKRMKRDWILVKLSFLSFIVIPG